MFARALPESVIFRRDFHGILPFSYHSFQTDPQAGITANSTLLPEIGVLSRKFLKHFEFL